MSEQFWSGVPLAGIALVLWGVLSAMFLLSLSFVAGSGAFRVFSRRTPDVYELWTVRAALWLAFGVSVWELWRWWHPRGEE